MDNKDLQTPLDLQPYAFNVFEQFRNNGYNDTLQYANEWIYN